ncbi:uncharacterized protein LOC122377049 [Amphibalanus amphitrite]|uniref:uncharacterized protein LOC122376536 n=1 Tax=Amphibalanus amphitrite TaxID=1232801 RepID=UPI001C9027F0|nr:uncharacterized protein LOC122376536 [Amphibalanus amphitrite]XP_043212947.1 uncharacterized protein LOC122377049 [Amphibalanus amphitrite]
MEVRKFYGASSQRFVPQAIAAGTDVCNHHCRDFHRRQLQQIIREKLRSFKEEQFNVQFEVVFFHASCIDGLMRRMKKEKYGWHKSDEERLVPYLGTGWFEQHINQKDYNRVAHGTFQVKPRVWGQLMKLRVRFTREKCVRGASETG